MPMVKAMANKELRGIVKKITFSWEGIGTIYLSSTVKWGGGGRNAP